MWDEEMEILCGQGQEFSVVSPPAGESKDAQVRGSSSEEFAGGSGEKRNTFVLSSVCTARMSTSGLQQLQLLQVVAITCSAKQNPNHYPLPNPQCKSTGHTHLCCRYQLHLQTIAKVLRIDPRSRRFSLPSKPDEKLRRPGKWREPTIFSGVAKSNSLPKNSGFFHLPHGTTSFGATHSTTPESPIVAPNGCVSPPRLERTTLLFP